MAAHIAKLVRAASPGSCRLIHSTRTLKDVFDVSGEEEFKQKVLQATRPVVVDFHASWCQPCKTLTPILLRTIEARKGKVDLAKVDVDVNQELAIRYGVTSIPNVILMRNGEMADSFVGLMTEDVVDKFIPEE